MNQDLSPKTNLSHYRMVSKIGAGGMGDVYLAEDERLRRKIALKVLPDTLAQDTDRLRRFEQEAFAASALNHPNILTIYEFGTEGATHFLASEFIDGETLRDRLQRTPLSLNETLDIAVQIAQALAAAHEANIIHRDIKPENVMLRKDGIVKVLDFGLAKLTGLRNADFGLRTEEDAATLVQSPTDTPQSTLPGTVMGTVSYMSPEQARGNVVDARTDIFSLGVMLYEMLTRRQPFTGETVNHIIVAILEKEPAPLSEATPNELRRIIRKLLTKDAEMRYQSSKDLLIDLKNLRRTLDLQGELEHSIVPNQEAENETMFVVPPSGGILPNTQQQPEGGTTNLPSSSSLEYAVTQAKSHKFATASIGFILLSIISATAYFGFFANSVKQIESIAVMPFINASGNPDVEYLSDGMTETLIKSLSELPNLNVKPRSSVFRYKGKDTEMKTIGKELNVEAILNGRVIQRGEQLTLSLELIDVQNDKVLWTESYQRKQSDLVFLQSEIAKDVSTKLKSKLSGADEAKVTKTSTANPEAYQAYLKGRYYWNRRTAENITKAIEQFKAATDRDPNYALAYAGLADCYGLLPLYAGTPNSEAIPQAKVFAERAIAIDDQLAEPHASLGLIYQKLWKWAEAEREFKRAIELNPNYATSYHWYSILLRNLGRFVESAQMIEKAKELDPLSIVIGANVSQIYMIQKDFKEMAENSLKLIELDPNNSGGYSYLGFAYLKLGRDTEAIANFEKAVELMNRASISLSNLGYGYAVTGKRSDANAIIMELEESYARKESSGGSIAEVYAGLGDKDKAFEWLEKDFQSRNGEITDIRWYMQFESLRDDPRYKDLLKRMGLPE